MKRTNSSARWLNEHKNDFYVKQSKKEGYPSRAAFKLLEIQEKDKLLKPGMIVVDLGASPGGWSMVAGQKVGPNGCVIALDLLPMKSLAHVKFIQGDFYEENIMEILLQEIDNRAVDLVMSDMSPNITGIAAVDQARVFSLSEHALWFAQKVLKPQGHFLIKVFQGQGFDDFFKEVKTHFRAVHIRKPKSSRDRSPEVYIVCIGFKP